MRFLRLLVLAILVAAPVRAATIHVFPAEPTADDPIKISVLGSCDCGMHFEEPPRLLEGNRILIAATANYIIDPPIANPYGEQFVLDPLPAGTYRIDFAIDGKLAESFEFVVGAAVPFLRFDEARLTVKVDWRNPNGGAQGTGKPVVLTPESGYFHFFDRDNVELTVKLLDGRPVNGHWWLFLASMTTLELEIEVTSCPPEGLPLPCTTKTYVQPAGQNRNFVDTSTF